ncbi:MAG: MFS transporter [Candidatus Methanomethyliaceae archaeon]
MLLTVLSRRNFALFWLGQFISMIGDWALFIALPVYVYELTDSALATGAMFIAGTLPRVLISSIAGVFVDYWDRRWTMIVADLLRAFIVLLLLLPLLVHSGGWLWLVYLAAFLESTVSEFSTPAANAIIPRLVERDQLMAANSLSTLGDAITRLIGPSLGGAIMGLFGLANVIAIDAVSYIVSGIMIFFISLPLDPVEGQIESINRKVLINLATLWREWLEGVRLVKERLSITGLFAASGIMMVGQGIINVLLVIFVETLGGGALEWGWIVTAQAIGSLIGSFIVGHIGNILRPSRLITVGIGGAGLIFLMIVNCRSLLLAVALTPIVGVLAVGYMVSVQTLLQEKVSDSYRGRIFGAYNATKALLMLGGMGLASILGDLLGSIPVLNIAGGFFLLASMLALLLLRGE